MERPDELNDNAEVQQLKAEISETQTELQQTVAEIQERLSPSHLKEQATETVRDATIGRMQHMMNRTNPIPLAMIGIGAAWLLASNRSQQQWHGGYRSGDSTWGGGQSQYGSTEYISSGEQYRSPYASAGYSGSGASAGGAGYSSGDWQEGARDRAGAVADRARDVASQARTVAYQARHRWDSMLDENPMALGIAALAAGALVGAALPQTEVENEYMGETRDQVIDSAKSMAHESVDKAKSVAQESVAKVIGTDQSST